MRPTDRGELRELSGGHPRDRRNAWYYIRGKALDPDEVTRLTGINPDKLWRVGDPKPRTGIAHPDGYWRIYSLLTDHDEFHDHIDALLNRLRPSWSEFVRLGRRYEAGIEVGITLVEAQGPLVQVLPDVARALSDLNATLGFDLYALPEPGDL